MKRLTSLRCLFWLWGWCWDARTGDRIRHYPVSRKSRFRKLHSRKRIVPDRFIYGDFIMYISTFPRNRRPRSWTGRSCSGRYVETLLNGKPDALSFHINKTPVTSSYVDVDVDIGLTHPFPGATQYNGYDVRGVFIANGSAFFNHNHDLKYAINGVDQYMMDDPTDGDGGGPDGYTRWFNPSEFLVSGIFGYTKGDDASPDYSGTATVNPYKLLPTGSRRMPMPCSLFRANRVRVITFSAPE